jgi:hypothetical protein
MEPYAILVLTFPIFVLSVPLMTTTEPTRDAQNVKTNTSHNSTTVSLVLPSLPTVLTVIPPITHAILVGPPSTGLLKAQDAYPAHLQSPIASFAHRLVI